jgi:outer membrane protein assembly factor BamB
MMAINPAGKGDITKTNVLWKRTKGLPYVPSPLLYEGRIFFIRDGGLASCYDSAKGEPLYESKRTGTAEKYYASPIAAGGYIYLASLDRGTVTVLRAAPVEGKPEVVSARELEERIFATPAIVGDRLYVRTAGHLYCFGEK